jgi:hypothetical protein
VLAPATTHFSASLRSFSAALGRRSMAGVAVPGPVPRANGRMEEGMGVACCACCSLG